MESLILEIRRFPWVSSRSCGHAPGATSNLARNQPGPSRVPRRKKKEGKAHHHSSNSQIQGKFVARRVCMQITQELSAGTRAAAQHEAVCHVSPACASCGVLRSAPGPSPGASTEPANRRFLALRGRRAHATAPTAGRRGAPSRVSMGSTVRARCIRRAWRLSGVLLRGEYSEYPASTLVPRPDY